jgi:hypothetical protein
MKKTNIVKVDAAGATLRRRIRAHLRSLGYTKDPEGNLVLALSDKSTYRALHEPQRLEKLAKRQSLVARAPDEFLKYFANGADVLPAHIDPELRVVEPDTLESSLFRFATLLWQIPVSDGFGRRLRFLVWDRANEKLMGLIALGDPVFNLRARDGLIGWSSSDRGKRLVNVLDAYVLGAVPPYNQLLGGKLIACLLKTREIVALFREKYGSEIGEISGKRKNPRLVLITTTSALGRSSVYNRLRIDGEQYLERVGFTSGFGHFHIPDDLFLEMRGYLRRRRDPYADNNRYGQGPSWRFRAIRKAFALLGLPSGLIQHGIQREVFICRTARNALELLKRGKGRPDFSKLQSVAEVGQLALRRWVVPRSLRNPEFAAWKRQGILELIHSSMPREQVENANSA